MGVYPIALVQWLSGRRVAEVYAMTGNHFFAEHAALDIEDYGALALRLDDGAWRASAAAGSAPPVTRAWGAAHHPDRRAWHFHVFRRQSPARGVQRPAAVHGAAGASVRSDADVVLFAARHQPRPKDRWVPLATGAGDADACAFLDCIDQGRRPQVTVADAVHHVDVILAGYESAVSGKPVAL